MYKHNQFPILFIDEKKIQQVCILVVPPSKCSKLCRKFDESRLFVNTKNSSVIRFDHLLVQQKCCPPHAFYTTHRSTTFFWSQKMLLYFWNLRNFSVLENSNARKIHIFEEKIVQFINARILICSILVHGFLKSTKINV